LSVDLDQANFTYPPELDTLWKFCGSLGRSVSACDFT
jgi:hypothetical protein